MKKNLSEQIATYGLLAILTPMIFFHILVMIGVVPFDIVWGGRLTNTTDMLRFESISILILSLMLFVVVVHSGLLRINFKPIVFKIALWLMAGVFLLNTLGNLQSLNETERLIFTPVTFLLFLFSLRLVFSAPAKAK